MSDIIIRQQFLIPPTPIVIQDGFIGMTSAGIPYVSSTEEIGDSFYHTFTPSEGFGVLNFRFEIHLGGLIDDADYYVIDADLLSIAGELVITVTRFLSLVPYPSWRFRLNLIQHPYQFQKIAPLSPEADITKVFFTEKPYWISTILGVEGRGTEYFFLQLSGLSFIHLPSWLVRNTFSPLGFVHPAFK